MKKIGIITSTRAEYGLLSPVIEQLRARESDELKVELVVTGTHLIEEYGMTINEIEGQIDRMVLISVKSETEVDISENMADALTNFTKLFLEKKYDAILLLGDRYETFAIAIAAGNTRTPIFHLCGGDTTEGALDEWMRHSITKISYLHFVTNEISRKRVIQLGEDPSRVFNCGSTSIDNILTMEPFTKSEILSFIGMPADCNYALCTYHPVTQEDGGIDRLIEEFLKAVRAFPKIQFIVTKSNADQGGARIGELLDEAVDSIANLHVYTSLGFFQYLPLMKYAEFVLGNSSSGIIEAPALHVPTVNIGDRQRGRLQSESVINCGPRTVDIMAAIKRAISKEHRQICKSVVSPYGDGNAAKQIAEICVNTVLNGEIDLKKKFYDIGGFNE